MTVVNDDTSSSFVFSFPFCSKNDFARVSNCWILEEMKMTRTKKDEKNKPIDSEAFESDSASLEVPDPSFPKKASVLSYGLN